jgi:hypothetical protein
MPRTFQVGFASAQVEGLFGANAASFREALSDSWGAGASVTRYGRTWRISRSYERSRGILSGRIGFIKEGDVVTYGWDPDAEDFRTEEASGGVIVPFIIDADEKLLAFQLRSGLVRPTTFTGAFQGLLNLSAVYRWQVQPLVIERSFSDWIESVQVITEVRFRLQRPNPNWRGRREVEHIVEELDAEVARLEARAAEGETLNTNSPLFRQALDHALDRYGRGVVRGLDEAQTESEWDSAGGGTIPVRSEVRSETDRDEVPDEDLERALVERRSELRELGTQVPTEDEEQ